MNETIRALAEAIEDADVHFASNYPGFHSNELTARLNMAVTSVDEKTAYAYAWGCSLAGKRAVVSFKNVGLNDAADAFLGSIFIGCKAGLVLILFDDCDIQHSQNRIDVHPYFDFYGGLWFEPRTVPEVYSLTKDAFSLSERFQLPVVVRIDNILYNNGMVTSKWERTKQQAPCIPPICRQKNASPFVAHPSQAHFQEAELKRKNCEIADFIHELYAPWAELESVPSEIICTAKRSINAPGALRIFTLPIPEKRLVELFRNTPEVSLTVYEHSASSYYRNRIAAALSNREIKSDLMSLNRGIRFVYHNKNYMESLFTLLAQTEKAVVFGDLGSYTMDPGRTIEACLCFGAACASGMGFAQARPDYRTFVVVGDAAYFHSGQVCLYEMIARKVNLTIFILENEGAQGTGGQAIPGNLNAVDSEVNLYSYQYDKLSNEDLGRIVQNLPQTGVNVVILHTLQQEKQYE